MPEWAIPIVCFVSVSWTYWVLSRISLWQMDGWKGTPLSYYRNHLRECVADKACPFDYLPGHAALERLMWWPIKKFGTVGAIFSFMMTGTFILVPASIDGVVFFWTGGRKRIFFP